MPCLECLRCRVLWVPSHPWCSRTHCRSEDICSSALKYRLTQFSGARRRSHCHYLLAPDFWELAGGEDCSNSTWITFSPLSIIICFEGKTPGIITERSGEAAGAERGTLYQVIWISSLFLPHLLFTPLHFKQKKVSPPCSMNWGILCNSFSLKERITGS